MKWLLLTFLLTGCYTYYPVEIHSLDCKSGDEVDKQSDQCRDSGTD